MDAAVVIPVGSVDAVLREQVTRILAQTGVSLRELVLSINRLRHVVLRYPRRRFVGRVPCVSATCI